jgi:hypothetical protein
MAAVAGHFSSKCLGDVVQLFGWYSCLDRTVNHVSEMVLVFKGLNIKIDFWVNGVQRLNYA